MAFEWLNSNREHLGRWTSFPERIQTVEDEEAFLRAVTEVPPGRREFVGRIMVGNQFAGSIGTVRTDPVNRTTEVGYSLGKEFEGNWNYDSLL